MMEALTPDEELRGLCRAILREDLTESEWAERESDDMFQSERYSGGYDAEEHAFCFSRYEPGGQEMWFQVSLAEVQQIANGGDVLVAIRPAEI